jgi:hypothetical protein
MLSCCEENAALGHGSEILRKEGSNTTGRGSIHIESSKGPWDFGPIDFPTRDIRESHSYD